jgi:hypothetical protein
MRFLAQGWSWAGTVASSPRRNNRGIEERAKAKREARVPVQDFNGSCTIRRRPQYAARPACAACCRPSRWFRPGLYGLAVVLLCGCTLQPFDMEPSPYNPPRRLQPAYSANQAVAASPHKRSAENRPLQKSRKIKQVENIAAIEPSALIGKEPSAVRKLLGSPADISERDVSLVWTYGSPECAFQVYFYPDIKTSMFHALQYAATNHDGGKLDLNKGCVQRLLVVRK